MVHQLTWGVVEEAISLGVWADNEFDLEHIEFEVTLDIQMRISSRYLGYESREIFDLERVDLGAININGSCSGR